MSLDIVQLGFKLLKNLEKVIFFTLGLAWVIMSMTLVIKFSSSDQGGVITEVEMPRGEVVESTEGPAQWQDYAGRLKDPEKFSAYEEYKKIARKGIFKPESNKIIKPDENGGTENTVIQLPDETLSFRYNEVIIEPFPIKYKGMFKIGAKLTAQINWGKKTYFSCEQNKIENYIITRVCAESVELEDSAGKKVILSYQKETYCEELKAKLSVIYKLGREELKEYEVVQGQEIKSENFYASIKEITQEYIRLKIKYKVKERETTKETKKTTEEKTGTEEVTGTEKITGTEKVKETEKEEELVLKLNETKIIKLVVEKI